MIRLKILNDECLKELDDYFTDKVNTIPLFADGYISIHEIFPSTTIFDMTDIMDCLDIDGFYPELVITD